MSVVRIEGVAASTRPIDSYGGIRLAKSAVESIAQKIRSGEIPFGLRHDPRERLDVQVIDAFTRMDDDGYTQAVVTFEVDEEKWTTEGEDALDGLSVSVTEAFLGQENETPAATISADAQWFSDDQLREAFDEFTRVGISARAERLYQFAAVSDALVVATFLVQQLGSIPASLLAAYIYDSLKHFLGRGKPSKFHIKFDRETGHVTDVYLETSSDSALKHAIDRLPAFMDNGKSYDYSIELEEWTERG